MRSAAPALIPIFRSEHQAELLARLFLSGEELSMSVLASNLDVALPTLHREIERLEAAGLLSSRRVGRARLVRSNADHPTAGPLTELLAVAFGPSSTAWLGLRGAPAKATHVVYQLRPSWRPRFEPDVFVPATLDLLTGPVAGVVDPPVNLYWQPGELDFGQPADVKLFYASALAKASTAEQFRQWINAQALIETWDLLAIPSRVRKAWETIHPQLRAKEAPVTARERIQDTVLSAIADLGFALAGGSALIDYDVASRDTDDIDAFLNRLDAGAFTAAAAAVIQACQSNGWDAELVHDQDLDKQVKVTVASGDSTIVQLVYHQRSASPERRPSGGLRLIFDDVVGGKAVAAADSARGRDFYDLATIVDTPGWTLDRVRKAIVDLGYPDKVDALGASIDRFRRGDYDGDIRDAGFDTEYCHRILDRDW